MTGTEKPKPSPITPRRTSATRGKRSARYPDLNYTALAKSLAITPAYLGRILNGQRTPSWQLAQKIAGVMGWTLDQVSSLRTVQSEKSKQKPEPEGKENGTSHHTDRPAGRTGTDTSRGKRSKQHGNIISGIASGSEDSAKGANPRRKEKLRSYAKRQRAAAATAVNTATVVE